MRRLSRVQKKPGMGRFVSAVTRRAASKGSAVFLTQMLRVSLHGLRKATYWPSGESWAPAISGLPKKSSRSRSGGGAAGGRAGREAEGERQAREKGGPNGSTHGFKASVEREYGEGCPAGFRGDRDAAGGGAVRRGWITPATHTERRAAEFPASSRVPWTTAPRS